MGVENPRRESRRRAALPGSPRGLGRALEVRRAAARGGRAASWTAHRPRLRAPCRFRRSVCAEPPRGLWLAGMFVAHIHKPCRDSSARPCMGALCPVPRPQVPGYLCRWQGWGSLHWVAGGPAEAAGGGATGVRFTWPGAGARLEGVASRPLHLCGCQKSVEKTGEGCLRCRVTACPLGEVQS